MSCARVGITVQQLAFNRPLDLRRPAKVPVGLRRPRADGGRRRRRGRRRTGAPVPARQRLPAGGRPWWPGVTGVRAGGGRFDLLARASAAGFFSPFGASVLGDSPGLRGVTARIRGRGWQLWLDETLRPGARWTEPVPGGSSGFGLRWRRRPVRRLEVTVDAQRRRRSDWSGGAQSFPATEAGPDPGALVPGFPAARGAAGGRALRRAVGGWPWGLGSRRRTPRGEWSAQVSRYRTGGWDTRIYEYEQDLPGAVSIRPLYGDGWRVCALAGRRLGTPLGQVELWLRGRLQAPPLRRQAGLQIDLAEPR